MTKLLLNPNQAPPPQPSEEVDIKDLEEVNHVLDILSRQVAEANESLVAMDLSPWSTRHRAEFAEEQLHLSQLAMAALSSLTEHSAENLRVSDQALQDLSSQVEVTEKILHASELVQEALRKINVSSKANLKVSNDALKDLNERAEHEEDKLRLSQLAVKALKELNQTSAENLRVSEAALKTLTDQFDLKKGDLQTSHLVKLALNKLEENTQEAIKASGLSYQAVTKLAFYDPLTGLPNRRLLNENIHRALLSSKRLNNWDAVLFLDLDKFKLLNDRYGHAVGDQLLIAVAERLKSTLREMDTVARFGGDEFTILLNGFSTYKEQAKKEAEVIVEKIRLALSEPYILDILDKNGSPAKIDYQCFASIGVAMFSGDRADETLVLDYADEAMYEAKHAGGNRVHFYDPIASAQSTLRKLYGLATALDIETASHGMEMQQFVQVLALRLQKMGLPPDALTDQAIELMVEATPLHDIGKMKIPMSILHKEGPLTPDEWALMRTHTIEGEAILSSARKRNASLDALLDVAIAIAGDHHERWDGGGYPRGLKGMDISLAGRIVAVADVYDALVNVRPYKNAWTHQQAVEEIINCKGSQFDPLVVEAFLLDNNLFESIIKGDLVTSFSKKKDSKE